MPPSEDEASLNDDEFVVPEDPVKQKRFKRRLIATAKSLKKEKRRLKTAENTLRMRWSTMLKTADKYGNGHQPKSYPRFAS